MPWLPAGGSTLRNKSAPSAHHRYRLTAIERSLAPDATLASLLLHSPFGPTTTVISSNLRVEISSYFTLPGPRSPQLCSPLSHIRTSVHVCTCRVNG